MAFDAKNKVAIVGVGHSKIGRNLNRPTGLLALDASFAAIEDAGLKVSDIDGLSTFPAGEGPGVGPVPGLSSAPLQWMVQGLGIERVDWWANGGGNISTAIGYAIQALATNCCNYVLVWRAMYQPRGGEFGSGARAASPRNLDAGPPKATGGAAYSAPYGMGAAPVNFAPAYTRYMKKYGARREHMAAYILSIRRNASKNPYAIFYDRPLSLDEYMNCRMIAEPLGLYDCDMPVDGAAAIVLARADRARDLKQPPAYITAFGSAGWNWKLRPPEEYEDNAANVGRTLWASTELTHKDIDGAMLYDGFSPDIYWWLEGLGFCKKGEAYGWIQNGRIELGGELPINTFGGSIGEGRLHGIGHWVEATKQVQGRADDKPGDGARQIPNTEHILVVTGMTGHGVGVILSKQPVS
jgi:acetyl-CoA acetyltransferase